MKSALQIQYMHTQTTIMLHQYLWQWCDYFPLLMAIVLVPTIPDINIIHTDIGWVLYSFDNSLASAL